MIDGLCFYCLAGIGVIFLLYKLAFDFMSAPDPYDGKG